MLTKLGYNQDSVVLVQGQTKRRMEQKRKPREGPTNIQPTQPNPRCQDNSTGKRKSFEQVVLQ